MGEDDVDADEEAGDEVDLTMATGDINVDLDASDLAHVDMELDAQFREQTPGRKQTSSKFYYDSESKVEKDHTVWKSLCALFDQLIIDAARYSHPFNTCGVERYLPFVYACFFS